MHFRPGSLQRLRWKQTEMSESVDVVSFCEWKSIQLWCSVRKLGEKRGVALRLLLLFAKTWGLNLNSRCEKKNEAGTLIENKWISVVRIFLWTETRPAEFVVFVIPRALLCSQWFCIINTSVSDCRGCDAGAENAALKITRVCQIHPKPYRPQHRFANRNEKSEIVTGQNKSLVAAKIKWFVIEGIRN